MSLVQQTLTKILYLQNIISYVKVTSLELLNMKFVHTAWYECVMEYSDNTWLKIYKKYKKYKSKLGKTLLHRCAKKEEIDMMKLFLRIGVNVP
jgi:hypothetical protein